MSGRALCVGDINADIILRRAKGAAPGQRATDGKLHAGGTAANTAAGLSKLGCPTAMVSRVGADSFGRFALDALRGAGVDVSGVVMMPERFTLLTITAFTESDDRDMGAMFPEEHPAISFLESGDLTDEAIAGAAVAHFTGVPVEMTSAAPAVLDMMRRCREAGVTVSFDMNLRQLASRWDDGVAANIARAVALGDILFASGKEELRLFYRTEDYLAKARELHGGGIRIVVCKNGADGAAAFSAKGCYAIPAADVPVVDTLGAGDTFNAGFLAAFCDGRDLRDCLLWGTAAAAFSLRCFGPMAGPTAAEIGPFIEQCGLHRGMIREL